MNFSLFKDTKKVLEVEDPDLVRFPLVATFYLLDGMDKFRPHLHQLIFTFTFTLIYITNS